MWRAWLSNVQIVDERYEVPFSYWIFCTIPSLFMQEPLLMEWASTIFPPTYLSKVVDIASPTENSHVPASAFLTLLMGVLVQGGGQHLHWLREGQGWDDDKVRRVEALRRGLIDLELVDE